MAEQWRILIVEDEESLDWNIVNLLQKDGYVVRGVKSGSEAIRLLWAEEYDLVICSQKMADADGFELLQWIRTYCPNTHMIMVASTGSAITRAQALEVGVASYLEKPLDIHFLKEELRRILHQTGFSASLDSFDLLDVIQIITLSRKSIALVVNTGLEEQGILRFQNGELIWAEYGMLRGEEAFFALAAHKNGTVIHRPWNEQIRPNVTQPLSRLIFQALQYRSKYAEFQQLSSEIELGKIVTQESVAGAAQGVEEDEDRPFVFVDGAEKELESGVERREAAPVGMASVAELPAELPLEQVADVSLAGLAIEDLLNASGANPFESIEPTPAAVFEQPTQFTGFEMERQEAAEQREWWEQSGHFPGVGRSGKPTPVPPTRLTAAEAAAPAFMPVKTFEGGKGVTSVPAAPNRTAAGQRSDLPAWLLEQPTRADMPSMLHGTGKAPAAPKPTPSSSSTSPLTPLSPAQRTPQSAPAEWQGPGVTGKAVEQGLRKPKPEQAIYGQVTGPQRPVANPPSSPGLRASLPRKSSSPEWKGSESPVASNGQSGGSGGQTGSLHSLGALRRKSDAGISDKRGVATQTAGSAFGAVEGGYSERRSVGAMARGMGTPVGAKSVKRNYPALVAALQTLGYSIPGFVASAVVGMDGQPIAQVAVDDLDISPLCGYFSGILRGTLIALEQGKWGSYKETVISSSAHHILLRIMGDGQEVFQVLVTTHEQSTVESIEAMERVETALVSALQ